MKKLLAGFVLFISILTISFAGEPWTPGNFEIHMIDVGQGMCQLVISPGGRTMLMDIPEHNWNSSKVAKAVAKEIKEITGGTHLDYIVASHLHLDHMGYAGKGGIWGLLNTYGITTDHLIDRDAGFWQDINQNGTYDKGEIIWKTAGTTSGTGEKWIAWVTDPKSDIYPKREAAKLGSTDQIKLGDGVKVTVVQVNAQGVKMKDGTPIKGDQTKAKMPPSENDYSITLLIQYKDFDYVFGGDTDGEYSESSFGYCYNNVEDVNAPKINKKVEALSVNHHGSQHSSNETYVNTLKPQVALYNVGENSFGHPTTPVVERFRSAGSIQYFTEKGNLELTGEDLIVVNGNIVIKTLDGKDYTVNGRPFTTYENSGFLGISWL